MLTSKFQLQDYGRTLLAMATGMFIVLRKGWRRLSSPKRRLTLFGIAFAAPILSISAYVFDLFQAFDRGEFPHWADSMGIPLMGVPFVLMILFLWSAVHLVFLKANYQPAPLILAISLKSNWWLLSISIITLILAVSSALFGHYWYAITDIFWLYFYLSLAAFRRLG
jgi:hypothetical protein